jgi:hypothetical protein
MISENCIASKFICITGLKQFNEYTKANVTNPLQNACSSGATLTVSEWDCKNDLDTFLATNSAQTQTASISAVKFEPLTANAIHNSMIIGLLVSFLILFVLFWQLAKGVFR